MKSSVRANRAILAGAILIANLIAIGSPHDVLAQSTAVPIPLAVVTPSRLEQSIDDALPATSVITRADIERIFKNSWLLRWTGSGTISQETEGVRGYTALTLMRGLAKRRAIAAEAFTTGEFDAPVPTENYGVKFAYRRSITRDWLVMETRLSCTFPREELTQQRITNWGIGIGFEMYFGTGEFLARPVTF